MLHGDQVNDCILCRYRRNCKANLGESCSPHRAALQVPLFRLFTTSFATKESHGHLTFWRGMLRCEMMKMTTVEQFGIVMNQ